MIGPVTVEEFLSIEEEGRKVARLRAPAREVRRFHAAVRRFASAWCVNARRRIGLQHGKQSVSLLFEAEDRYDWVPVMSLKAVHNKGEFVLKGPYPERNKVRLSTAMRKVLADLHKTWKGLPGAEPNGDLAVQIHLPKLADSGFDRFLQAAIDACAEL